MELFGAVDKIKTVPVLFENKEDCCGCGSCLNVCPKQAITMQEDECGFIYPVVDIDKCVEVTNIINPILDREDPIKESYTLDVSTKEKGR